MAVTESTPAKSVCLTCTSSSLHTASLNSPVVISPGSPPSNSVSSWPTQLLHPCLFPLLGFPLTQAGNLGYVCDVFFSFPSLPVTPKSSIYFFLFFYKWSLSSLQLLCHYLNSGSLLAPVVLLWPLHLVFLLPALDPSIYLDPSVAYLIHMGEVEVFLKFLKMVYSQLQPLANFSAHITCG